MALIDKLTAIADAIRGKTGKTDEMTLDQMVTEIAGISGGGSSSSGDDSMWISILNRSVVNFHSDAITTMYTGRLCENCKSLISVDLPNLISFYSSGAIQSSYCFNGCTALKTVSMSSLITLSTAMFQGCTALEEIVLPSLTSLMGQQNFYNCTGLKHIDFAAKTITSTSYTGQRQFMNCTNLTSLVLRAENYIWTLSNVNTFDGTPFASGGTGGTVYVPQALIESYQTATNWSTLYAAGTCNFVAIEGSEYE